MLRCVVLAGIGKFVADSVRNTCPAQDVAPNSLTEVSSPIWCTGVYALMVYSDVDDTTTCPARGADGRTAKQRFLGALAGSDTGGSNSDEQMEYNEIYYGYGTFVQMLAYGMAGCAEWRIVSANPKKAPSGPGAYPHIYSYMNVVASECTAMAKASDISFPQIQVGDEKGYVDRGSFYMIHKGHAQMGVRKLDQLLSNTARKNPQKAVFIGDTGQGDVCAGLCFVDPAQCSSNAPLFYELVQDVANKQHYPTAAKVQSLLPVPGQRRYALFHMVGDIDDSTPLKLECYEAAKRMKNIGFYGQGDEFHPRDEYIRPDPDGQVNSALEVAIDIGAMDPKARDFVQRRYSSGEEVWQTDCISPLKWSFNLYTINSKLPTCSGPHALTVYSDVDDTTTCPARGSDGLTVIQRLLAAAAGTDSCGSGGDEQMEHNEIYYGYGTFVQMLAYGMAGSDGSLPCAEWRIVSANPSKNPWGGGAYPHIEKYMKLVASECATFAQTLGVTLPPIQVGDEKGYVDRGSLFMIHKGYAQMGVRKLDQLLSNTARKNPQKAVFIGDTGQGDVCAGLCFVDPAQCSSNAPLFYELVQDVANKHHYPTAANVQNLLPVPGQRRYALFHMVGDIDDSTPLRHECYEAAQRMTNIGFYGQDNKKKPRDEYIRPDTSGKFGKSALKVAIDIGAMDPKARDFIQTPVNSTGDPVWQSDCIAPEKWDEDLYRH